MQEPLNQDPLNFESEKLDEVQLLAIDALLRKTLERKMREAEEEIMNTVVANFGHSKPLYNSLGGP